MPAARDSIWWQLLMVLAASVACESVFLHHGLNLTDEGWPLYAAMRLHSGGVLFQDVYFTFPPGHLLAAWIAYGLDPPGVVLARMIYSGFNLALCLAVLLLGRRLMAPSFALLGALLVAVAAPDSHSNQLLFGYRYLVFTVLALLAFSKRLRSGDRRWMLAAGLATGVALCFRLTPAFAACCGIGIASMAADRAWRSWLADWSWFGLGFVLAAGPLTLWFAWSVGPDVLWREVVIGPVAMTIEQSMPIVELSLPAEWNRSAIQELSLALLFRASLLLYLGYALLLAWVFLRSLRTRTPFQHTLLLAVVIWGGVYFLRSLGRSDVPHMESAIPPVCLLLAHLSKVITRRVEGRAAEPGRQGHRNDALVGLGVLAAWTFLLAWDVWIEIPFRGEIPMQSVPGTSTQRRRPHFQLVDSKVRSIMELTNPGDTILDLTGSPMFYVLSGRLGPGYADIVMPGTFLGEDQELEFLERLKAAPPALVIFPRRPFDDIRARAVERTAPQVSEWVIQNYRQEGLPNKYILMVPNLSPDPREGR